MNEVRHYGPDDVHPTTEELVAEARAYRAAVRGDDDAARRDRDHVEVAAALAGLDID